MPGRPKSPGGHSEASDADIEVMVETELAKLKQQYRTMEGNRLAYTRVTQESIKKQRDEISKLENERSEYMKELRLSDSANNRQLDEDNIETLLTLNNIKTDKENDIKLERKKINELDTKIFEMEKQIREIKRDMGGAYRHMQHSVQTGKKIRVLHDRLQQVSKKFCGNLEANRQMREKIEDLRIERVRYSEICKKLQKKLSDIRKKIGESIETASNAYDARDDAQAKMLLLKEKAEKDIQQHSSEMKELIRVIDHDRKLRQFMLTKGQERHEDPQLVAWRKKKEEIEAKKKKASQQDSIETYQLAFEAIRKMTGRNERLDLLVENFIEVEETNFALFNYVNEQNNQMEDINDEIQRIHTEIHKFKSEAVTMDECKSSILRGLEEKQIIVSADADKSETQHKEIMKVLDQLRAGIDSLFNRIGCDPSTITDMLGATATVTDSNMLQYLGIIEQRTNDLLTAKTFLTTQDVDANEEMKTVSLLGEGPHAPHPTFPVIPPTVGDEFESSASDDAEDENHPRTREELQNRVLKTVQKREVAAKKDDFKYNLPQFQKVQKKDKKDAGKK